MGELRRDPIIGQWVVVDSPQDSLDPESYGKEDHSPRKEAICQFCQGREKYTPPEVKAIRTSESAQNSAGWQARVVPNKFPALRIEGDLRKRGVGLYDMSNGVGAHEVLIESPEHKLQLEDLALEDITGILGLAQSRILSLEKDRRFKYIMLFKNFGESAGASVEHAHSQIIALPMVPKTVLAELEGARAYFEYRGRCVYCDMIEQEYQDEERIINQNENFLSFCPYVPRYPFEAWILPKDHEMRFKVMNDQQRFDLAGILKDHLLRIRNCLSCSYNLYLHLAPVDYKEQESYHWHIEILPQLLRESGYEWGTGFYLVRTEPSMATKYLKEAIK